MQKARIRIQKLLKHNPNLSETDLSIIHQFSDYGSNMVNYALNTDMKGRIWNVYEKQLNSSLTKFQSHNGITYRGGNISSSMLEKLKEGEIYEHRSFMSSSSGIENALKFAKKDQQNPVLFIINGKRGRNINDVSYWGDNYSRAEGKPELEVLFKSKSRFKVESVKSEDAILKIYLSEI